MLLHGACLVFLFLVLPIRLIRSIKTRWMGGPDVMRTDVMRTSKNAPGPLDLYLCLSQGEGSLLQVSHFFLKGPRIFIFFRGSDRGWYNRAASKALSDGGLLFWALNMTHIIRDRISV